MKFEEAVGHGHFLFQLSPYHRKYSINGFHVYWVNALRHNKARLFFDNQQKPVGLCTWCWMTDEESELFLNDQLMPTDAMYARESGDQLWGIEVITPFGGSRQLIKKMREYIRERYGPGLTVHFKRYKQPGKLHKFARFT